MNKLSESKPLRIWTYLIVLSVIIGILAWQTAPIILATVELIKALK